MASPDSTATIADLNRAGNRDAPRHATITLHPLCVSKRVRPEDAAATTLSAFLLNELANNGLTLADHDVVVVTSKLTSLFEGRTVRLAEVHPGRKARMLGRLFGKDPRKLQLLMAEGRVLLVIPMKRIAGIPSIWRKLVDLSPNPRAMRRGFDSTNAFTFIARKHAVYMDEAGLDHSNVPDGYVSMLPIDPCGTAERLRRDLKKSSGRDVAVIITDTTTSIGRLGCQDVAIGFAGIEPIKAGMFRDDLLGVPRSGGAELVIDSIAGIAGLAMGQSDERTPAAIVRGISYSGAPRSSATPDSDSKKRSANRTMDEISWPADAGARMVLWSLLATTWFHVANALTFSRWPEPTARKHDQDRGQVPPHCDDS